MDVKLEDAGPCRKLMHVNASADTVAGDYAEVVDAFKMQATVPGFRQGKAPSKVVEQKFSKRIADEAKERLVPVFYRKALEQEGIEPVAVVEVKDVTFGKDEGLAFNVMVDVRPEFKLPKYKKISIRGEAVAVSDEEVDSTMNRLREQGGTFEDVTGRTAKAADLLKVDYTAICDSQPLSELVAETSALCGAEDFMVFLAEPELIPGFTEGLTGAEIGETRDVEVIFPEDYRMPEVAGKTVLYTVHVKGIQERVLAEINESFLKPFEVDSESALRDKIKEELLSNAEMQEKRRQKDEIARYLLDKTQIEPPQSIVESETRNAVRGMVEDFSRRGASREQIQQQQDSILSDATRTSTERVKLSYILGGVADQESITADDSEVDARIAAMAQQHQLTPKQLRERMEERDDVEALRNDLRAEKALDLLLEQAKIKR
jgi:trigger factor